MDACKRAGAVTCVWTMVRIVSRALRRVAMVGAGERRGCGAAGRRRSLRGERERGTGPRGAGSSK